MAKKSCFTEGVSAALLIAVMVCVFAASPSFAAGGKSKTGSDEIVELKQEMKELQKEISELKGMIIGILAVRGDLGGAPANAPGAVYPGKQGQAANAPSQGAPPVPQEVTTTIGDNPTILGDKNAPVTIVEFSDYECPFCARFYSETFKQIKKEYIDIGKVRFVYRDFPLPFHQNARKAALAVNCAGEQKKYWEMHNAVFENQQSISDIDGIAKKAGVDVEKLNKCIESKKYEAGIEKDINGGGSAGVGGTPSFIISKSAPDGSVKGKLIPGALPLGAFKAEIDALLKQ